MSERGTTAFRTAFALLAAAAVAPLWSVDFLPLTDLPQHEAQVSVLRHWQDPQCGYPALYEIRWFSPYWLTYALAWVLSWVVEIPIAFKVLLSLAVLGLACATARLVRSLGGDPWWSLLCLPLGYGSPTSWGFVSFVLAAPLVLALLAPAFRYARHPTPPLGLAVGLALSALFFVHVLAMVFAAVILLGLLLATATGPRSLLYRLAPLAIALPLPLAWWWQAATKVGDPIGRTLWLLGLERLTEIPRLITGIPGYGLATAATALVLLAFAAGRPRPARERLRWIPLVIVLGIVLFAPNVIFLTSYLAPRFAIFLFPALLCAFDRTGEGSRLDRPRVVLVLATLALLVGVEWRYLGAARETAGLRETLDAAPSGRRLLYLSFDRTSRFSPDTPFLHSGMRYALGRCGVAEPSFARSVQLPIGFRPGRAAPLPRLLEYAPHRFRWSEHGGDTYDLFLMRAEHEPDAARIAGGAGRLAPLAHAGRWWLYANARRAAAGAAPPAPP